MSDVVRVMNKATGHQYNMSASLAEADPDVRILPDRPTHTAYGVEIPPLYAAEIPPAPKSPGARRGSATAAAASPEAEKEALES
jgi:hypothetical protein